MNEMTRDEFWIRELANGDARIERKDANGVHHPTFTIPRQHRRDVAAALTAATDPEPIVTRGEIERLLNEAFNFGSEFERAGGKEKVDSIMREYFALLDQAVVSLTPPAPAVALTAAMVEAAARAIYERQSWQTRNHWDDLDEIERDEWIADAQAALAAAQAQPGGEASDAN
jgi:hypothetical protein